MITRPNDPIDVKDGAYRDEDSILKAGTGLTKREYFAALSLQGILANSGIHKMAMKNFDSEKSVLDSHCMMAVDHADALIKELNK